MDKLYPGVDEAVADIPDGASIAISGFFTAGTPIPLIKALAQQGAKNLTIICMQMGPGNEDINQLVINKQIKKAICNYPFYRSASRGADSPAEQAVRAGEIEMEVYPMGTFSEKLRAAGAGIAAFYTPTGVGTVVEQGKEKRKFGDRECLLELLSNPTMPSYTPIKATAWAISVVTRLPGTIIRRWLPPVKSPSPPWRIW